ncbi:uncharacterized protein LAESUDRAFT_681482 [Laetiporus sulphureus 93-53]|uniref:Protein kinase domain-containing protein n=1 Tax=Laetiporus sulphureus 93-53 TaxID=1314785 RepID=A0A165DRA3_9APHY|nr:uncharacterized protein LAESUDRAFT_681482 [Laetiporus sulphureus 93-53]KZT05463.1 hypothetical protein LAESUDRAFT_681482 [Laetiporus sulphureus 93-53]
MPRSAKLPLLVARIDKEAENQTSKRKRKDLVDDAEMDEGRDEVSPLTKRFKKTINTEFPSPSVAAEAQNYYDFQNGDTPFLDGRCASEQPLVPAPIVIYDPIFPTFIADLSGSEPVDDDMMRRTQEFMVLVSEIHVAERAHYASHCEALKGILQSAVESIAPLSGSASDHIIPYVRETETAALAIVEEKAGLGKSGDAVVQAEFSYRLYWKERKHFADGSFLPTFLISLMGPYLSFSAAIWTTDIIVQPLASGLLWLGSPPLISDFEVKRIARMFIALRKGLESLRHRYQQLLFPPPDLGKRFFPLASSFPYSGKVVHFNYEKYLKANDASCLVFSATLDDTNKIVDERQVAVKRLVIKFVEQYGEKVHKLLAEKGLAPKLYYCGDIWHNDPVANKGCGPRKMVVMEYIEGERATFADCVKHKERLSEAVDLLHHQKMVHGDIRLPNILISGYPDAPLKLLDFDWAGVQGEARYPGRLSTIIPRDWDSVKDYGLIEYRHDKFMLEHLLGHS